MAKLSTSDFRYYRNKLWKDKGFHEKEFIQRIDPDLIDSYYEGYPTKNETDLYNTTSNTYVSAGVHNAIPDRLSLNTLFPSTATLVAQFYPQNPKFIGIPRREEDELASKVAAAAMNYYFEQMNAVKENQKAIISCVPCQKGIPQMIWFDWGAWWALL